MSKRKVGSILAGIALATTLSMTFPGSSEAAGWTPALRGGDVLELVLHWFSSLWNGDQGTRTQNRTVLKSQSAPPSTATSGPLVCGGDQGVCIDPNG
jgi:hypothetical protein